MALQSVKTQKNIAIKPTCNVFSPSLFNTIQTFDAAEAAEFIFDTVDPVAGGVFSLEADCYNAVVQLHAATSPDKNCDNCVKDGDYVTTPLYFYLTGGNTKTLPDCLVYRQGTVRFISNLTGIPSDDFTNNPLGNIPNDTTETPVLEIFAGKCNTCCEEIKIPDSK